MDDLTPFTGPILVLAGVVLQFALRQFKAIPEWGYWLVVAALTVSAGWLTGQVSVRPEHLKLDLIQSILWLATASATVRGGSSVTDLAATKAVAAKPALAGNPLVPKSNSL